MEYCVVHRTRVQHKLHYTLSREFRNCEMLFRKEGKYGLNYLSQLTLTFFLKVE